MNLSLSEFIAQNYIIENQPLQHDLENTHIFLLGEHHESFLHRKVNATFIDLFAHSESPILIEAEKACKPIEQETNIQSVFLKRKFNVFGWDKGRVAKFIGKTQEIVLAIEEIRKKEVELNRKKIEINESEGEQVLKEEISQKLKQLKEEAFQYYQENDLIYEAILYANDPQIYSERNELMIKTIAQFAGPSKPIAYLISGWSHLKESISPFSSFQPIDLNHSLLKGIHVTILTPKKLDCSY